MIAPLRQPKIDGSAPVLVQLGPMDSDRVADLVVEMSNLTKKWEDLTTAEAIWAHLYAAKRLAMASAYKHMEKEFAKKAATSMLRAVIGMITVDTEEHADGE